MLTRKNQNHQNYNYNNVSVKKLDNSDDLSLLTVSCHVPNLINPCVIEMSSCVLEPATLADSDAPCILATSANIDSFEATQNIPGLLLVKELVDAWKSEKSRKFRWMKSICRNKSTFVMDSERSILRREFIDTFSRLIKSLVDRSESGVKDQSCHTDAVRFLDIERLKYISSHFTFEQLRLFILILSRRQIESGFDTLRSSLLCLFQRHTKNSYKGKNFNLLLLELSDSFRTDILKKQCRIAAIHTKYLGSIL